MQQRIGGQGKQQAVYAVEHAAVAGQELAGIFNAVDAF